MCGVNGFNFKDENLLEQMNKAIAHRGPDFSGTYFDNNLSLGHVLLSIRERKELSIQPFKENLDWVLLFNGQIYNTRQLKKNLENTDATRSDLDTYILYKVIEKYGWDFINYIQGMFIIALYNTKENILRIYRDQTGQKPLYYYNKDDVFIFSSEIKGILCYEIDKTIDEDALFISTRLGYIPGEKTLFKYIKKINPSSFVEYKVRDKSLSTHYYKNKDKNYFPEKPEEVFEQLIEEHIQSKQNVSINLSGGLDSSLLLHEMTKFGHNIETYSTIFDKANEKYNRDAVLAKKLAKDYGATHNEIFIDSSKYLENFIESYENIEEPNFNITLPVYLLTAKKEGANGDKKRVILSGNGGDEIFAGYPHYYQSLKIDKQMKIFTPFFFNLIKNKRNSTNYHFQDMDERWLFFREFRENFLLYQRDSASLPIYLKSSVQKLIEMYGEKKGGVYEMMERDRYLWMPAENFIQADKLFMSQSVEVRSPLSFQPLRTYFDLILKEKDYVNKEGNKVMLRDLYKNKLPDYIVERKDKTGWRSPIIDWYNESLKKIFLDVIPKKDSNLIKWKEIRNKIESRTSWPGKTIHLYLSLAILAKKYNIDL